MMAGVQSRCATALLMVAAVVGAAEAQPQRHRLEGFRPVEPVESWAEEDILDQTNAFRAEHGRGPVRENSILTEDARAFAAYLARTGGFDHEADGRTPGQRAEAAGYDYCEVAENLAYAEDAAAFRERDLATDLMRGWEASPGHRRNLLDPDVVEIGVGVARAPGRTPHYVAVQEFGRPAAMRYAFKVTNRTGLAVSYAFEGRTWRIEPGTTITHRPCAPGELVFQMRTGRAAYPVGPDEVYVLERRPGAGLTVEIMRRRA
jgi:uncharacterized protein YkwD